MRKQISLNGRKIEYVLKESRRSRRLRLTVHCDGSLVVSTPRFVTQGTVDRFFIEKKKWILDKVDHFKSLNLTLLPKSTKADYLKNKERARLFAIEKVAKFNEMYGFDFNKVNIKDQKSRWGSCSRKGNLSFSYKIALLPEGLADYIIVHELCHLREFNHSRKFWDLVARAIPDHREKRKQLKKTQALR